MHQWAVALDNSALSDVLNVEANSQRFVSAVHRKQTTIFLSITVFFEGFADEDVDAVARRLQTFQRLHGELRPLLCMSLDNNELLQAEAQRRLTGPLKREGDALRWLVEAKPADLLNVAETLRREAHDFISKKKKELFELDKGEIPRLLRKAGIRSSPAELVAQIEAAGPPRVGDWTVERTASLSNGAWSPDQIVADPVRFRATHVTSHLVWRLFLANCADPQVETSPKEKQVLGWWRDRKST